MEISRFGSFGPLPAARVDLRGEQAQAMQAAEGIRDGNVHSWTVLRLAIQWNER